MLKPEYTNAGEVKGKGKDGVSKHPKRIPTNKKNLNEEQWEAW